MRLRRGWTATTSAILVIVAVVMMTTFVVIEPRTLLEVIVVAVRSAPAVIPAVVPAAMARILTILVETSIMLTRRSRYGWRSGRGIALIGSWRVGSRRLVRVVRLRWVASAHWSGGITRRTTVKAHSNRRTHGLGFWLVVVSSSTSASAILLLGWRLVPGKVRRHRRTPLLGRTTWLLLRRVRPVRLLDRSDIGRLLWLAIGRLLLLRVVVLSIVGVVVLRRQSRLTR